MWVRSRQSVKILLMRSVNISVWLRRITSHVLTRTDKALGSVITGFLPLCHGFFPVCHEIKTQIKQTDRQTDRQTDGLTNAVHFSLKLKLTTCIASQAWKVSCHSSQIWITQCYLWTPPYLPSTPLAFLKWRHHTYTHGSSSTYYSFIDPKRMNGWVGHVGWHTAEGLPRGGHPLTARHGAGEGKFASHRPTF